MKMSRKPRKRCLGCKCLEQRPLFCQLGYEIKSDTSELGPQWAGISYPVPKDPCPKPMTNKDWITARNTLCKRMTNGSGPNNSGP